MNANDPLHPHQVAIWDVLDRAHNRKEWAYRLGVTDSAISLWSSGSRAMSIDYLRAAIRVLKTTGKMRAAADVRQLVDEMFGDDEPAGEVLGAISRLIPGSSTVIGRVFGVMAPDSPGGMGVTRDEMLDLLPDLRAHLHDVAAAIKAAEEKSAGSKR